MELIKNEEVEVVCAAKSEILEMLEDILQAFVCKAVNDTEICKYWQTVLKNIRFLNDLIDWQLGFLLTACAKFAPIILRKKQC